MLIEGPLKIGVLDQPDGLGRELHLSFGPAFRTLDLAGQGAALRRYVGELRQQIEAVSDMTDRDRQGMLIILQIAEELLPHVAAGEMALEETIVVEMGPETRDLSLVDLLPGGGGGCA